MTVISSTMLNASGEHGYFSLLLILGEKWFGFSPWSIVLMLTVSFCSFPLSSWGKVIHTVKGFGIVNKADIDVFLELFCFFNDPANVGNLISGSSTFYKTSLNIWKFMVHILLKPYMENFEHFLLACEMRAVVVWAFFSIAFLWDWNENWPLPVLWPLLSFPNLLAYWVQHFHSIIF